MKVKMLTRLAGPERVAHPGDVIEVEASEAKELIAGSFAEPHKLKAEVSDGSEENDGADRKPDNARGGKKAA